jgi:hypothetical protein
MGEHDLTLSGEEVANHLYKATAEIEELGASGPRWTEVCRWVGHPNIPAAILDLHLRAGLVAAWLNVSSPLMLLNDHTLHQGLVGAVCSCTSMRMMGILAKLKELHPAVVEQVLLAPPPQIRRKRHG